ncbi:MAG: redox-regulated ATPase YchF [Nitrospinota bacterium]|nr:MAG: redox-regulated ATPase YchF [Nitrospinota bacterium]
MEIGIIGLPQSGKTTVFNALTQGSVPLQGTGGGKVEVHRGVSKVPDARLAHLGQLFAPRRVVPAEVRYIDIGGAHAHKGVGEARLTQIRPATAIGVVIRCFAAPHVPHPYGRIDPLRDYQEVMGELLISDLQVVEGRLERLKKSVRRGEKASREELELLERCLTCLEEEQPLRTLSFAPAEEKLLRGFQFLTAKPLLIILNMDEEQIVGEREELLARFTPYAALPQTAVFPLCGALEMEIAQLDEQDSQAFLQEIGEEESARSRLIRLSYQLLHLISFFTIGTDEVKAWTIRQGTPAVKAAGVIHSDMERGFIKAEVISYETLVKAGSFAEARKQGLLRLEGKDYTVQDGDIITFRFNV